MGLEAFKKHQARYHIASQHDFDEDDLVGRGSVSTIGRLKFCLGSHLSTSKAILFLLGIVNALLFISSLHSMTLATKYIRKMRDQGRKDPQIPVFSPAQHLIRYHDIVYSSGLGAELSKYQGAPSPEVDEAWRDLYNFGISKIPMKDARHLANRTVPIPDDPGYYAIGLDVFHQLHCPNMIRLRVWFTEEYLPDAELMGIEHIDHCIDSIRQSLMCASDLTPLPFVWSEEDKKTMEVARVLHTCRDFEAIRQWGVENHIGHFDKTRKVHDPLDDE